MKENKNPILNFLILITVALAIYSVFQISNLFESYSDISRVNVAIVEMIEDGSSLNEIQDFANYELFRRGYRGRITASEKWINDLSQAGFDEVKDGKIAIEIKYYLHLPFEMLRTRELTMISKR